MLAAGANVSLLPPCPPVLLVFHTDASQFAALIAPLPFHCLQSIPDKCVCWADKTIPVAELGDSLQRGAVAMYPRCPTARTTCSQIILKCALLAHKPTPSVSAKDVMRPPTALRCRAIGHAPSGSLDNGSTACSAR